MSRVAPGALNHARHSGPHHHIGSEEPIDGTNETLMPEGEPGGLPQRKRKRVTRACSQCRKRKDKCDGQTPACARCQTLGILCHYSSGHRKRGLPTGYVRAVEVLWGLALTQIPQSEKAIRSQLRANPGLFRGHGESQKDDFATDYLQDVWRKSTIASDLELLLIGNGDLEDCQEADAIGEDYGWQTESTSRSGNTLPEVLPQQGNTPKLPTNFQECLQGYLSHVHCWLPVLEKHVLLRAAYSWNSGNKEESLNGIKSGQFAALWAMLAYVCDIDSRNNLDPTPHTTTSLESTSRYSIARSLISWKEGSTYDLGHLQALILLGLYKADRQEWTAAWHLIGQAVRIAVDIGLGRNSTLISSPSASSKLDQRQKRVFLGCFVLDTLLSIHMGKLPYLSKTDVDEIGWLDVEGLEEWEPWQPHSDIYDTGGFRATFAGHPARTLSVFNAYTGILSIFNDLIREMRNGYIGEAKCQEFLHILETWRSNLPSHILSTLKNTEDQNAAQAVSGLPHFLNLCLTYTSLTAFIKSQSQHRDQTRNLSAEQIATLMHQGLDETQNLIMRVVIHFVSSAISVSARTTGRPDLTNSHLSELPSRAGAQSASINPSTRATLQRRLSTHTNTTSNLLISSNPTAMTSSVLSQNTDRTDPQVETSWEIPRTDVPFSAADNSKLPSNPSGDVNFPLPETELSLGEEGMQSIFDDMLAYKQVSRSEEMPQLMLNLGFSIDSSLTDLYFDS